MKRRNWLQGWTELKASRCLLFCRDVQYSGSLYFSAAPQILIFMNVPQPVPKGTAQSADIHFLNCSILTSECYVYFYTPLRLSRIHEQDLSVEWMPALFIGGCLSINACICEGWPQHNLWESLVSPSPPHPPSFLSKAVLENSHKQQCWHRHFVDSPASSISLCCW